MTNANRSIGLMVGCVVLIGAAHVVAQDWPQWQGTDRDGKVAEFAASPIVNGQTVIYTGAGRGTNAVK